VISGMTDDQVESSFTTFYIFAQHRILVLTSIEFKTPHIIRPFELLGP